MTKGLKALEKTFGDFNYYKSYDIVEKELKALNGIVENFKIDVYHSWHSKTGYEMRIDDENGNSVFATINEQTFNLLKEVLS